MTEAVVIGYGSIGSRHAEVLSQLGCTISVVTAQKIPNYPCYMLIEQAFNNHPVDIVVIANPTHLHYPTLQNILELNFQGAILVEKPLFSRLEKLQYDIYQNIYVAYHLRFHELFQHVKNLLRDDELISFSVQVGSYLPEWRKSSDYRSCYSAKKECGGGALRDLSHELDYVIWLCGKCIEVTAIGGHFSTLEINSDDVFSILMRCEFCPVVNIQLDYLNRKPRRKIILHTKKNNTISLDLIQGDLIFNGETKCQVNDGMQKAFSMQAELMLKKNFDNFCDYTQGLLIVKLIESIEKSVAEKKWITV